jgi:hypothetical protein
MVDSESNEGEFIALGHSSQQIYINPSTQTVIVKNSANHRFTEKGNSYAQSAIVLELFRAIAHRNKD